MNLNSIATSTASASSPTKRRPLRGSASLPKWLGSDQPRRLSRAQGRHREGEYHSYCLDHVREYNKSSTISPGMRDDDIVEYQRSASTGHRPTWNMGVNKVGAKPQSW